jgi:hypothetical protein
MVDHFGERASYNPQDQLERGLIFLDPDLVKQAVEAGADVNREILGECSPFTHILNNICFYNGDGVNFHNLERERERESNNNIFISLPG